jgi:hypothetical protein
MYPYTSGGGIMTEWHLVYIGVYLLIGMFLADTFLVKINSTYWFFLLFYPIIIVGFFGVMLLLWSMVKLYEIEERLQ